MPTEPEPLTVARAVRRAVEACDPADGDPDLGRFLRHFEDADEPISGGQELDQRLAEAREWIEPDDTLPSLLVASAIVSYLAYRRDEADAEPARLMSLAARAEFHNTPPDEVVEWLEARGVRV